mgnify:CR=1 FL=1
MRLYGYEGLRLWGYAVMGLYGFTVMGHGVFSRIVGFAIMIANPHERYS